MLVEKYRPRTIGEFVGNKPRILEIKKWISGWKKGTALMLHGPEGCGKNLAMELIATESGRELVYYDGSHEVAVQRSLFAKNKLIIADEPGKAKGLPELISKSSFPVVILTTEPYKQAYRTLRTKCKLMKLEKIPISEIANFLERVCTSEKTSYEKNALMQVAFASNGDMRAALNDLETLHAVDSSSVLLIGNRERVENIFTTLKTIFKTKDIGVMRKAIDDSEKPMDELYWWIENNVFKEFSGKDLALVYEYLAIAELYNTRVIKRQKQSLMKYLVSVGILSIAVSGNSKGYGFYSFPRRFYRKDKSMDELIAAVCRGTHTTTKEAETYLPLIKSLAEKDKDACKRTFGLLEDFSF
ncbi:MAG: AAA family ATPase [Candidatus Aenigmatarchaeota archaeon]